MIVVLKPGVTEAQIALIVDRVRRAGLEPTIMRGTERTVIAVIGDERPIQNQIGAFPFVEEALPILPPYKLASREFKKEDSIVPVGALKIGGKQIVAMAGPCSVETRDRLVAIAESVKEAGATVLRGGAFKPRTSPHAFQGLKEEGLEYLSEARAKTGLPVITEIMDARDLPMLVKHADIIQIGARNMQNFRLLESVGGQREKPVMLKRGLSATIKEFLLSAEYLLTAGNEQVILCERGIRTFETETRNTLDLSAVPVLRRLTHLPIIVDPSHAVGKSSLVAPMAKAAIAAGADGVMIEVHSHPQEALCDGDQALLPNDFKTLMGELKRIALAIDRTM